MRPRPPVRVAIFLFWPFLQHFSSIPPASLRQASGKPPASLRQASGKPPAGVRQAYGKILANLHCSLKIYVKNHGFYHSLTPLAAASGVRNPTTFLSGREECRSEIT